MLFAACAACSGTATVQGSGQSTAINAPLSSQPNYNAGPADTSQSAVQRNPQVQVSQAESSAPLMLARPAPADAEEVDHAPFLNPHIPPPAAVPLVDPVLQRQMPVRAMPASGQDFAGQGVANAHPGPQYSPPDTNGVVGPNDYVQTVNADLMIWDKTAHVLKASVQMNSLWAGYVGSTGNDCANENRGDPVVVYDPIADRWFLTQFSLPNESSQPNFQCVAVSKTSDPTGTYWLYDFSYPSFNDYGKFGIWPDAYYATFNNFTGGAIFAGADLCAYDRVNMLQGHAASQVCFQQAASVFGALPVSMEGPIPPPRGEPGIFMALGTDQTSLDLWTFHADFVTPANSTLTGPTRLPVAGFTFPCAGQTRLRCVPQPPTSDLLESLGDRLMFRLAYRNFGTHESLVLNHSVVAGSTSGLRWYEVRSPTATPVVFQQGTFAPADTNWRWMGSIAQDQAQDFAIGYSVSSATTHPSIAWAGRLQADPNGTLGQAEAVIDVGTGVEAGGVNRWGDYSNMTVDPTDDCTFWYTQELYNTTNAFQWDTRIATVKFPRCAANDFSLSPAPATVGVAQAGQNSVTVNTGKLAGTAETITLNVQDLPLGVSGTFAPPTVTAGTPSVLTLKALPTTPLNATPATFEIIGTAPSAVHMATAAVTIDGPPTAALTQPANGAILAGTVAITGTASAGAGTTLASLTLSVDGTLVQTGATSPQTFNWDTTALANGSTHTLTATATDADNGTASQSVTVTIKNPPVPGFTTPANGATVAGLVSVTGTGTPALGTTLSTLALQIDGGVVQTGAVSPQVYGWDTTTAAQGSYSLAAVATDADGASSTKTITVIVKNAPVTSVTSPANGSTVKGQVAVNAAATPALGAALASLSIGIDGTSVATGATSPQTYNWDTTTVTNGTHGIAASATDNDGPVSNASVSVTVKNDPAVAITAPANNATVSGSVPINVTATPPNGTTLTTLALSIDGTQVKSGAASPLTFSWDTTALSNGSSHTLTATATDADGSTATATSTVTVKNNPVVTITSPDGGTVNGTVVVTATTAVPPGTTLSSFALSIDGTTATTGTASPLTYSWDTRPLANGTTHALVATAVDADGTTATSATLTVTVNNASQPDAGHPNDGGTSGNGDGGSSNGNDGGTGSGSDGGTGGAGGSGCGCGAGADASTLSFAALGLLALWRRRRAL